MTTQLIKYIERLRQADQLIRLENTGTPKIFAAKIRVGESTLYGILDEMKAMGLPLSYDRSRKTYLYTRPVRLQVEIRIETSKPKSLF